MKYWKVEHNGECIRIEWNESATFNLQTRINDQWVDYECFTRYGLATEQEALEHAHEYLALTCTFTGDSDNWRTQ
tara:strand:- start:137 stop:361 length:225 start_codon:yes stop_codon:yes gene_type:complete